MTNQWFGTLLSTYMHYLVESFKEHGDTVTFAADENTEIREVM